MARARATKPRTVRASKTRKKRPAKTARKPPAKQSAAAHWDAFDVDLEQQIIANPTDVALRRVYTDWMLEAGNPRGELAALQLAGQTKAEEAFLEKHWILGRRRGAIRFGRHAGSQHRPRRDALASDGAAAPDAVGR
jgi:uncharacterized protein (TIGR02996 family)